jgi:hypothetical protein
MNYAIREEFAHLVALDVTPKEYHDIRTGVEDFAASDVSYWAAMNNTCAESAMDIIGRALPRLAGMGMSPIKIAGLRKQLESMIGGTLASALVTSNDTTRTSMTNPYALYRDLMAQGYKGTRVRTSTLVDQAKQIRIGINDPLIDQDLVLP